MRRTGILLVLLAFVAAILSCDKKTAARSSTTVDLELRFEGLIAFIDKGHTRIVIPVVQHHETKAKFKCDDFEYSVVGTTCREGDEDGEVTLNQAGELMFRPAPTGPKRKATDDLLDGGIWHSHGVTFANQICNEFERKGDPTANGFMKLYMGDFDASGRTKKPWEMRPAPDGKATKGFKENLVTAVTVKLEFDSRFELQLGTGKLTSKKKKVQLSLTNLSPPPIGETETVKNVPDNHFKIYYDFLSHNHPHHLPYGEVHYRKGDRTVGFMTSDEGMGCPPLFFGQPNR